MTVLNVLLIDDDPDSLRLLKESLPETVADTTIRWEDCGTFEEAFQRIEDRRFDVVVTDIYRDRTSTRKDTVTGDPQGKTVLDEIRDRRFCPVAPLHRWDVPRRALGGSLRQARRQESRKCSDTREARGTDTNGHTGASPSSAR